MQTFKQCFKTYNILECLEGTVDKNIYWNAGKLNVTSIDVNKNLCGLVDKTFAVYQ